MYEALDAFLNVDTWDSTHWADDERFLLALDTIIRHPAFNAVKMGDYIIQKAVRDYGRTPDDERLNGVRDHCVRAAEIISCYLKVTNR